MFKLERDYIEDPENALVVDPGTVTPDPELLAAGAEHLDAVRAATPGMFDGVVLALDHLEGAQIHARRGSYFDMVATCDALAGDPEMRRRAEQLAGGDPLRLGTGRTAAVGATVIVERSGVVTIGRRSDDVALDPGRWHIVPSGTVDERGLVGTVEHELASEFGAASVAPLRVIGLGWDLTRLRPELALMTTASGARPQPSAEFAEIRDIELDGIAAAWELNLTPAAAVALASLERHLSS